MQPPATAAQDQYPSAQLVGAQVHEAGTRVHDRLGPARRKEEFRIDAAFEIENSTSIYSGLLRFADLTMVAPNTVYPMFIVAPGERRNRVREQLARPSFRYLGIHEKVRYLSYEKLNEIEEFFDEAKSGLSVEVFVGKSESLPA